MKSQRITKLQKLIAEQGLAKLFISHPTNIYYLTGIRGVAETEREFTALVDAEAVTLFVPEIYKNEGLKVNAEGVKVEIIPERHYLFTIPAERLKAGEVVGIEAENLRVSESEVLAKSGAEIKSTYGLVESARISKDADELKLVRKAVEITDQAFEQIKTEIKVGMSEKEVAKRLNEIMAELGGEGISFDPIVASGEGSSLPHYNTSDKKIEPGIVLIDAGAKYHGYCGDLTRVFYIGEPDQLFKDRYEFLLKAQKETIAEIKPGMTEEQVWKICNNKLGEEAKFMIHGLGHGVGLDIHETPYLRQGKTATIVPGMLITVEPGLYYEGWGGMRIEDYVLVTETGVEVLSQAKRELSELIIAP